MPTIRKTRLRTISANDKLIIDDETGQVLGITPDARTPPTYLPYAEKDEFGQYQLKNPDGTDAASSNLQATEEAGLAVVQINGNSYALLPVSDGAVVANVVPRTGLAGSLANLDGNQGELASATDQPVIFKFTGEPGKAQAFKAYGQIKQIDPSPYSGASLTLELDAHTFVFDGPSGGYGPANVILPDGYEPRQEVRIVVLTNDNIILKWTTNTAGDLLEHGRTYTLAYTGSGNWAYVDASPDAAVIGSNCFVKGKGSQASQTRSTIIGANSLSEYRDTTVLGSDTQAMFPCSLVQGPGSVPRATSRHTVCLGGRTTGSANAQQVLSFDGLATDVADNFPAMGIGIARCRLVVIARRGTSSL